MADQRDISDAHHDLADAIREAGEAIAEAIKTGLMAVARAIADREGRME